MPDRRDTVSLRVATFNIRSGRSLDGWRAWPLRRRATLRAIVGLDADVIGLQEVYAFQLRWLRRHLPDYEFVRGDGRSRRRRGEHCPLLVRRGVVALMSAATRWYGDAPDTAGTRLPGATAPRIATVAAMVVSGRTVQVLNTHLDEHIAGHRLRSATQLLGWLVPGTPAIVLGDMNAPLGDPALVALADGDLRPALRGDEGGTAHDFTGRRDGPQIDHVFTSREWDVGRVTVGGEHWVGRWPSDHWPVVADVVLR